MAQRFTTANNKPFTNEDKKQPYDEYLILLQQRNRLLNKLKKKDEKQLQLEQREQGFSLFLNGANVDLCVNGRKTKTAGAADQRAPLQSKDPRARTAPSKPRRKGWSDQPVEGLKIKTRDGEKLNVQVPEVFSGDYSEDFEASLKKRTEADSKEEENRLQLTFTIEDAKLLRESLQKSINHNEEGDEAESNSDLEVEEYEEIKEVDDEIEEEIENLSDRKPESDSEREHSYSEKEYSDSEKEYTGSEKENSDAEADSNDESIHSKNSKEMSDEQSEGEISEDERISDEERISEKDGISEEEATSKNFSDGNPYNKPQKDIIAEFTSAIPKNRPVSASRQKQLQSSPADVSNDVLSAIEAENNKIKQFKGGTPKSRPLSATKKKKVENSPNVSSDVLKAIEEENKRIKEFRDKRAAKSAPIGQRTCPPTEARPQTVAGLSESDILTITEQVRRLSGRQQRKLVSMLEKLELSDPKPQTIRDNFVVSPGDDSSNQNEELLSHDPPEEPINEPDFIQIANENEEVENNDLTESVQIEVTESDNFVLTFVFESNWGNGNYIGLTEVEFVDIHNKLLKVEEVCVKSSHQVLTNAKNITNAKNRTTKEQHMLKCEWNGEELVLQINVPVQDLQQLSRIVVWNYNQSLQDLNIGVKDCKISKDELLVWKGTIEKGCGNQIFDYSHVITLNEPIEEPERCETRLLCRSDENPRNLPNITAPLLSPNLNSLNKRLKKEKSKEGGNDRTIMDKTTNTESKSSEKKSEFSWLESVPTSKSPTEEEDSILTEDEVVVRPRPKSGRRSAQPPKKVDDDEELFMVKKPLGRRVEESKSSTDFKERMDIDLEASFKCINNFNTHHMGRIGASLIDDDEMLSSYLEPMKEKDIELFEQANEMEELIDDVTSEELFEIPLLPKGRELIINIKTTWGDSHYVGLNGIEVFSKDGTLAKVQSIEGHPEDINVLPEYDGDPRVVSNLIDGCYLTRDDLHLWLTPYTLGGDHFVVLHFQEEINIAMIRIWNYNKSRIHSSRGACFVEMALDGKLIFIGEIARASGVLSSDDPYGDTILFTTDEDILELVALNDATFDHEIDESEEASLDSSNDFTKRPSTANKNESDSGRPFTCPKSRDSIKPIKVISSIKEDVDSDEEEIEYSDFISCQVLTIFLGGTWGDKYYMGLTGFEVLGETFEKIPIDLQMIEAVPRDLNVLDDYEDDDRTLDKLIDGVNVTTSDEHMWMVGYEENGTHLIKITFPQPTNVTGLRVWNYNKTTEDTFRGVKTMFVYADDQEISPPGGFLVRKGPGHVHFDYAQDIIFNQPTKSSTPPRGKTSGLNKVVNEYESVNLPSGFVFQLKLFSSWGDGYYIGLNGLEVYDQHGVKIELTDNNITAFPDSVNVLPGVEGDARTPDKLIDGVNDMYDGRHMWLAPLLPSQLNTVYIIFDEMVTLSMIKLWNYSKTPNRGVRTFGLLVDDLLVYSGLLPQCGKYTQAIVPGLTTPVNHHTILFTDDTKVVLREKGHILSGTIEDEQKVQLTNDRSVLNPRKEIQPDQAMRPKTSVRVKFAK